MSFLIWLESTSLSVWIRESPSLLAFPFILFLHTLGLAMLVGGHAVICFIILGFARDVEWTPLDRLFPLMWLGFSINAVSGILLLIAYPAKAVTNPVFYAKLALIAWAVIVMQQQRGRRFVADASSGARFSARDRRQAWLVLGIWAGAIATGRFLAYTYSVLMASEYSF